MLNIFTFKYLFFIFNSNNIKQKIIFLMKIAEFFKKKSKNKAIFVRTSEKSEVFKIFNTVRIHVIRCKNSNARSSRSANNAYLIKLIHLSFEII